jgi:hypothetical protein
VIREHRTFLGRELAEREAGEVLIVSEAQG